MKEIVRLDILTDFMVSFNWGLLMGVWLYVNNLIPVSLYYALGTLPFITMELLPRINAMTTLLQALKLVLFYENIYTLIFVTIWFAIGVGDNQAVIVFLLVIGKGFNLLGRNYYNKFTNLFNRYYKERAVKINAKVSRASFRGAFLAMGVGAILGHFGLDVFVALFGVGQLFSLVLGVKLYCMLEQLNIDEVLS